MAFRLSDFQPMPEREGWSRVSFAGGELRARTESLPELERVGLLDLERWRGEELGGVVVNRKPDRWVRAVPGEARALFAKYRRGSRRGEWLEELLHVRLPRSAAAREEQATRALESVGLSTARVILSGEATSALGVERESFLVTEELVGYDPIESVAWSRISPALRALLRGLSERKVAVPDLYAKHLFLRRGAGEPELGSFALVDLPRVETRPRRSALELFVRHAAGLVATIPGASARELALAAPGGGAELLESRIEERAKVVRRRKKLAPPDRGAASRSEGPAQGFSSDDGGPGPGRGGYPARTRYLGSLPVERYRERSLARHGVEQRLLSQMLPERLEGAVLDVPCGLGRMGELLQSRGGSPVSVDISPDMVREARGAGGRGLQAEIEHLPLADRSVDGAVCFRFLHHLPTRAARVAVLRELARVSRRFVVLTWFHPVSAHHLRRLLAGDSARHSQTLGELRREAGEAGLVLRAWRAQAPYLRDLWIARFEIKAP